MILEEYAHHIGVELGVVEYWKADEEQPSYDILYNFWKEVGRLTKETVARADTTTLNADGPPDSCEKKFEKR